MTGFTIRVCSSCRQKRHQPCKFSHERQNGVRCPLAHGCPGRRSAERQGVLYMPSQKDAVFLPQSTQGRINVSSEQCALSWSDGPSKDDEIEDPGCCVLSCGLDIEHKEDRGRITCTGKNTEETLPPTLLAKPIEIGIPPEMELHSRGSNHLSKFFFHV